MKIITCWAPKGGIGKSTIAVTLAHYIADKKNAKVLLVDADDQCSIKSCFDDEELASLVDIETSLPKDISAYDYVIFDMRPGGFVGNGRLVQSEIQVLKNSDVIVAPFLPSKLNYESLMAAFQLKFDGVLVPVMNQFKGHVKRHSDAFSKIDNCLPLKHYESFGNSEDVGKTIFCKQPYNKGLSDARYDFTNMARDLFKKVGW